MCPVSQQEMAELRYQETMDAIGIWLGGQKGKGSAAEAMGLAKAFLQQAAFAITVATPGCDVSDARLLTNRLGETVIRFVEEKQP